MKRHMGNKPGRRTRCVCDEEKKERNKYLYIYKYCIHTSLQLLCFGFLSNNCAASHQMHSLMTRALDPSLPCPASQKTATHTLLMPNQIRHASFSD